MAGPWPKESATHRRLLLVTFLATNQECDRQVRESFPLEQRPTFSGNKILRRPCPCPMCMSTTSTTDDNLPLLLLLSTYCVVPFHFHFHCLALPCSSHTRTLSDKNPIVLSLRDLLIEASLFFCVVGSDLDALPGF